MALYSQENSAAKTPSYGDTGGGFEIPMDKFEHSYAGFDPEYRETMLGKLSGWEPGKGSERITDYYAPQYGKVGEAFGQASAQIPDYYGKAREGLVPQTEQIGGYYAPGYAKIAQVYDQAGAQIPAHYSEARGALPEMFQSSLSPALQKSLNALARRNILKSSVAGESLGQTGRLIGTDILGLQSQLSEQEAQTMSSLANQRAGLLSQLARSEAESKERSAASRLAQQAQLGSQQAGAMTGMSGTQAGLLSQLASAEAGDKASYEKAMASIIPGFIGDVGGYSMSEKPFQPIQAYLNLIEKMVM